MYAGWVIKMWGDKGTTTPCGDGSKITGYVTMAVNFNSAITAASDCSLTSNAKTQWAFTTLASNGYAGTATSAYSIIFLGAAEDTVCGGAAGAATCASTANAEPLIFAHGGCTFVTQASMGVGGWTTWMSAVDYGGAAASGFTATQGVNALAVGTMTENINHLITNGGTAADAGGLYSTTADTIIKVNIGSFLTTACFSGYGPDQDATASTTYHGTLFGFTGAVHTCLDFAIDGFTLFGQPFIYKVKGDMSVSVLKNDATDATATTQA